jgi:hypothetical protein
MTNSNDNTTPPSQPPPPKKKSISRDRAILAYVMAIIIPGVGHIVVARYARGILIIVAGFIIGFVSALIGGLILAIIAGIIYWIVQLIDLYKLIHNTMEVVRT